MKKLSYIGITVVVALAAILSFSCEKDDICPEGTLTTPLLVIEFFDADIHIATGEDVLKNVTGLWVEAVDPTMEVVVIDGVDVMVIVDPIQSDAQTVNTVSIPLRTQQNSTEYRFISGYEEDDMGVQTAGNEDIITFNYEAQEIFLSRACGYIVNYTLEDDPTGAVITTDTDNWITPATGITVDITEVQNETIAHVKIYH
ncbi:hypothetical protein H2O64_09020 [Kordia sp. YSTF-M3]|uniref:DUF4382 domain-containing protein n=1 Tax=Kordia aestuariivivens TaxID=2759037 RepID=A0ABR7Q8C7_9FLAO|nr:DUF6452 family protein [Kordia aestuariivivens]MBC8754810.1 hypothetical protein [Kordia aestuariivivens]